MKEKNPLSILFGGKAVQITLVDKTKVSVFVRELPQRYLSTVLDLAERPSELIEACCYIAAGEGKAPMSLFVSIPAPAGMWHVPAGWADNLSDASHAKLLAEAKALNFTRAIEWGMTQIAAKKSIAPLRKAAMEEVAPLIDQILKPLLARLERFSAPTPNTQPSPDAAAMLASIPPLAGSSKSTPPTAASNSSPSTTP